MNMIPLLLICFSRFVSSPSGGTSTFSDIRRGYEITTPTEITVAPQGDYFNPAIRDTEFLIINFHGKRAFSTTFIEAEYSADLITAASQQAISPCATDGDNVSTHGEKIDSGKVLRNPYGLRYAEVYAREYRYDNSKDTSYIVGPFFAVDISTKLEKRILFLPSGECDVPLEDAQIARIVLSGIRMTK